MVFLMGLALLYFLIYQKPEVERAETLLLP